MIFLIHWKGEDVVKVFRNTEEIPVSADLCQTFWELAEEFPEEILVWVEKDLYSFLPKEKLEDCFAHDLIMSSYAVKTKFLFGEIGYVDQLPFINIKSGVKYPTWRMSSDVGGIKAGTLLKFRALFGKISYFDYLLNSIAKLGQQNGLFCYSDPQLIDAVRERELIPAAGNKELFSFVYQHYKSIWVFVLFFCLAKYERRIPVSAFLQSFLRSKFFKKDINLSDVHIAEGNSINLSGSSIDVIIPTIGRAEYLGQVVTDLSLQSLLPRRVIIVEQQPDENSGSELNGLLAKEWPFEIVHIFTHKTGACMARNKALEKIESEWIFFADDDIRLEKDVLADTFKEVKRLKVNCINLNCKQPGEDTIFHKIKQWGSFGSGTSIVRSRFIKDLRFSEIYEHGYGEDVDFGMKLREKGCDIIYHPKLEIKHLKAPVGGFRKKPVLAWEMENLKPKPSPTLMVFIKRHYSKEQIRGYKVELFLRNYFNHETQNPLRYYRKFNKQWEKSEEWAAVLLEQNSTGFKPPEKIIYR